MIYKGLNMLINPINNTINNTNTFKGGPNPTIAKNQMRILLTQDIWAPKLKIKKPESPLEKEVLLEVLQNRMHLDRFARLKNDRFKLISQILMANSCKDTNSPEYKNVLTNLSKRGNLASTLNTLDKDIEMEEKKNRPAIEYFKEIDKTMDEYLEKHLIKYPAMEKFWYKISKNNINQDGKYSTKELINIVQNNTVDEIANTPKATPQLTKKQLFAKVEKQYEQILRETVDVYDRTFQHANEAREAQKIITKTNAEYFKKFPGIEKQLPKLYEMVENRFIHKMTRLQNMEIYPIGEIWAGMQNFERKIRLLTKNIPVLKEKLKQNPNDAETTKLLESHIVGIYKMKKAWLEGLECSIKYEKINHERAITEGLGEEYDYVTAANKNINKYKNAHEIYVNNKDELPEDFWANIVG